MAVGVNKSNKRAMTLNLVPPIGVPKVGMEILQREAQIRNAPKG